MKTYGIGLLGFGTVGAGVVEGLLAQGSLIADRIGCALELRRIADLDLESDRGVAVDRSLLTADAAAVVDDPSIDIVVELIGGCTVARELILQALSKGKTVVTANKALLAEHGTELMAAAEQYGADLLFEASVAGGIPIIRALREGLVANHIESVYGILNGTCNYILTRMEDDGLAFDVVLDEAQKLGFAEAEPSLDVDGLDSAHKLLILNFLAYGFAAGMEDLPIEGIRRITPVDVQYARQLGYRIKLLACLRHEPEGVSAFVGPVLVPLRHPLASVSGVYNAVLVKGDITDDTLYYGRGAGRRPTAGAVIADLAEAARNLSVGAPHRIPAFTPLERYGPFVPQTEVEERYYLRLSLLNRPGVLSDVARILGDQSISIASVIQDENARRDEHVDVIVLTQKAPNGAFDAACAAIEALESVDAAPVRFRVATFA